MRKCAYQLGSPEAIPEMAEESDPAARFAGSSHSTAEPTQRTAQVARAALLPQGPLAPADEGTPTGRARSPGAVEPAARSRGHTSAPITA